MKAHSIEGIIGLEQEVEKEAPPQSPEVGKEPMPNRSFRQTTPVNLQDTNQFLAALENQKPFKQAIASEDDDDPADDSLNQRLDTSDHALNLV